MLAARPRQIRVQRAARRSVRAWDFARVSGHRRHLLQAFDRRRQSFQAPSAIEEPTRRLLDSARSLEGLAAAVESLQKMAAVSGDAREVPRAYAAARSALDADLARPCREHLCQDALRSRVP